MKTIYIRDFNKDLINGIKKLYLPSYTNFDIEVGDAIKLWQDTGAILVSASNPPFSMGGGLDAQIKGLRPDHQPKAGKNQLIDDVFYTISVDEKLNYDLIFKGIRDANTLDRDIILTGIGRLSHEDFCRALMNGVRSYDNAKVSRQAEVFCNAKVFGNAQVYGNARVYDNAKVFGNARVYDNARVMGEAEVYGYAEVYDNARVCMNAQISGDAQVYGDAKVFGNARVYDNARVMGEAEVYGYAEVFCTAQVYGNARVYDNVRIFGNAQISGDAHIFGNAQISGDAQVYGDARVCGNAYVCGQSEVYGNALVTTGYIANGTAGGDDIQSSIAHQLGMLPDVEGFYTLYKRVDKINDTYVSCYDLNFSYCIGETVEVEAEKSHSSCASGIHLAPLHYWNEGTHYLECKVHIDDIITCQKGKVRCRRAKVIRDVTDIIS